MDLDSSYRSTREWSCVVRRAPTLQMNSSIVVVAQDAKSNLQMFVWSLLQRDSITKARSALSRFRMCRSV